MGKIVEGYWDCPYCDNKGISGLEKHCTACGHPQDEGTKFYLKKDKVYVDKDKADKYGKGADWTCAYCGSMNRHDATRCESCGADREESTSDYYENVEKQEQKKAEKEAIEAAKLVEQTPKKSRLPLLIGIGIVIAILIFSCMPKKRGATVDDKAWYRSIAIESLETVNESDWTVPDGGRVLEEKDEIHHYDSVLDHYETVEVEKSREVQDGYDVSTEYVDNGDGTFSEEEVKTPKYVTEYYTEEEEQPVYVEVPVYQTKYYYEIDKWIEKNSVDTEGTTDDPYWGDVSLSDKEREGERTEEYLVTFVTDKNKTYEVYVDEDMWNSLEVGDGVDLEITSGDVTAINGEAI